MSLSLLLEKYDVSTDEGLQKALNDIEKEEAEVDEALCNAVSRASLLEGRLRAASQSYTKLGNVKSDALVAEEVVQKTASLAQDVSAKVRQLDLARSRVAEVQRRVHDLIDLQLCSAGVEAALRANDYETGAGHVSRFLSMDPGSLAAASERGAHDPREVMTKAANTLYLKLKEKFEEAARKNDDQSVEHLHKLFAQIGRPDEGLELFANYLAVKLESECRSLAMGVCAAMQSVCGAGADKVKKITQHSQRTGQLYKAIAIIQPKVNALCRRIYTSLKPTPDLSRPPLEWEDSLNELTASHDCIRLYFNVLRRMAQADASTLTEEAKKSSLDKVEKIILDCDLTRTAQDILAQYLSLERHYLEESVNKALKMATSQAEPSTYNLADDVFFICRKVIRRSTSSGSTEGLCTVINLCAAVLDSRLTSALSLALNSPLPSLGSMAFTQRNDHKLNMFLTVCNECEVSSTWCERLAEECCRLAQSEGVSGADLSKVTSCASGLSNASTSLLGIHQRALQTIRRNAQTLLSDWAETIAEPIEDDESESESVPAALTEVQNYLSEYLSEAALSTLLTGLLVDIADRAEAVILTQYYNRASALCVERRCRRVRVYCSSLGSSARERMTLLSQMAELLSSEGGVVAPYFDHIKPDRRRAILARRTDFKPEELKKMKL